MIRSFLSSKFTCCVILSGLLCLTCGKRTAEPGQCQLTAAELSTFRGLRLDIPAVVPGGRLLDTYGFGATAPAIHNVDEIGYREKTFYRDSLAAWGNVYGAGPPNFIDKTGLERIELATLDGNLVEAELDYDKAASSFESLEQVVNRFSAALKISTEHFRFPSPYNAVARCNDFEIEIRA